MADLAEDLAVLRHFDERAGDHRRRRQIVEIEETAAHRRFPHCEEDDDAADAAQRFALHAEPPMAEPPMAEPPIAKPPIES